MEPLCVTNVLGAGAYRVGGQGGHCPGGPNQNGTIGLAAPHSSLSMGPKVLAMPVHRRSHQDSISNE